MRATLKNVALGFTVLAASAMAQENNKIENWNIPGVQADVAVKIAAQVQQREQQIQQRNLMLAKRGANPPGGAAAALAAPVAPLPEVWQGDTYCSAAQTGLWNQELRISKSGSYDGDKPWVVELLGNDVKDIAGAPGKIVTDAVVTIEKDIRFDRMFKGNFGLGGFTKTEVQSFVVKATVKSESTELGMMVAGCLPSPTKEVDILVTCYDHKTQRLQDPQ